MPAYSRWERTMPCLLDRLVEDAAVHQAAASAGDLFLSPQRYLETVRRDIFWLLKTEVGRPGAVRLADSSRPVRKGARSVGDLEEAGARYLGNYPNARSSTLAFGIPTLSGGQGSRAAGIELARAVEYALRAFEPRIDSRTLRVRLAPPVDAASENSSVSSFGFEIEVDIRMKPLPEHLLLKAYYLPAFAQWRIEGAGNGP